jgi:hypothetical protein
MYLSSYIEVYSTSAPSLKQDSPSHDQHSFKGMRDGKEENRQIYTGFTGKT